MATVDPDDRVRRPRGNLPDVAGTSSVITLDGVPARGVRRAGVDLGDVDRFQLAVERSGGGILRRICTDAERESAAEPSARTALFSMKESVVKLLGGLPSGGRYRDISLGEEAPVRPVRLRGPLAGWADLHTAELVAGYAVIADRLVLSWAAAVRR